MEDPAQADNMDTILARFGAAVARHPGPTGVLPYIEPQTDWVRLPRRFPVEIDIPGLATRLPAFRGGNARIMVLF